MGNLEVLDPNVNTALFELLNPGTVMVGLNISRLVPDEPFRNFHDPSPAANDFKIRFAFRDTAYWGAYMTDVIKGSVQPQSGKLMDQLKQNPAIVRSNIETLRAELRDLGQVRPLLLAFGAAAHALLSTHLATREYSRLVRLTHYSHRVSQDEYRRTVSQQIRGASLATAKRH